MKNQIQKFNNVEDLKVVLANNYQKQVINYLGDEKKGLKFLTAICSAVQRTPKLLNCEPTTVINSFMVMAQLELMPSDISGEAYVLPYGNIARFQLGYQGLITLFYRAGAKSIIAEIVYENDRFDYTNGVITHSPDVFAPDRGEAIGAYVIVKLQSGENISKVMKKDDILAIGKKFSKTYNADFSPWKEKNDPQLWMWKKSVLKQLAKLVPKNETIYKAIAEDNKDSNIEDRMAKVQEETENLKMGKILSEKTEEIQGHAHGEDKPTQKEEYEIKESEKEQGCYNIFIKGTGSMVKFFNEEGNDNKALAEDWVEANKV